MKNVFNITAPNITCLSVSANVDTSRFHIQAESNVVSIYNYLQEKFPHIRHEGIFYIMIFINNFKLLQLLFDWCRHLQSHLNT
jgi:hypothetical protein